MPLFRSLSGTHQNKSYFRCLQKAYLEGKRQHGLRNNDMLDNHLAT